ncbi:hypothetical protein GCM10020218_101660 [Dactylosporangium vinaceum]
MPGRAWRYAGSGKPVAVALAGRPGARLAARSAITASRSPLLRLLRATPASEVKADPRVSGVDDLALRRRRSCGGRALPRRHAAIQQLRAQRHSLTAISRQFGAWFRTVQRYLRPLRPAATTLRPAPAPEPRRVMTKPEHLNTEHSATLTGVLVRCAELRAVRGHIAAFAAMMSRTRSRTANRRCRPHPRRRTARRPEADQLREAASLVARELRLT